MGIAQQQGSAVQISSTKARHARMQWACACVRVLEKPKHRAAKCLNGGVAHPQKKMSRRLPLHLRTCDPEPSRKRASYCAPRSTRLIFFSACRSQLSWAQECYVPRLALLCKAQAVLARARLCGASKGGACTRRFVRRAPTSGAAEDQPSVSWRIRMALPWRQLTS